MPRPSRPLLLVLAAILLPAPALVLLTQPATQAVIKVIWKP